MSMNNKAPEKIYYAPYGDMRENKPITDDDIEYIRTDAFIEKAVDFLCDCIEDCMGRHMETWSPEMKAKTIDNFKNYMKL